VVVVATVEPRLTAVVAETTTWPEYPAVWRRALDEVYGVVRDRPELSPGDGWLQGRPAERRGRAAGQRAVLCGRSRRRVGAAGRRVATATHHGDYAELGRAHDAVHRFAAEQELTLSGVRWEIYGHAHELTTEVYWLLAD
jgi:hypothetical protein